MGAVGGGRGGARYVWYDTRVITVTTTTVSEDTVYLSENIRDSNIQGEAVGQYRELWSRGSVWVVLWRGREMMAKRLECGRWG